MRNWSNSAKTSRSWSGRAGSSKRSALATQSWSGRLAVKFWSTRSGCLGADGSGTVVRRRCPRMKPSRPSSRVSRTTVRRAASTAASSAPGAVEQRGELPVPIPDHVTRPAAGVFEVHDQVLCGLHNPALAEYLVHAGQAACAYSCRVPPSIARRRMSRRAIRSGSSIGSSNGRRGRGRSRGPGAACARDMSGAGDLPEVGERASHSGYCLMQDGG